MLLFVLYYPGPLTVNNMYKSMTSYSSIYIYIYIYIYIVSDSNITDIFVIFGIIFVSKIYIY